MIYKQEERKHDDKFWLLAAGGALVDAICHAFSNASSRISRYVMTPTAIIVIFTLLTYQQ